MYVSLLLYSQQGQPLLKGPPGLGQSVLSQQQQQGMSPGLSSGIPSLMGQQLGHGPINQGIYIKHYNHLYFKNRIIMNLHKRV